MRRHRTGLFARSGGRLTPDRRAAARVLAVGAVDSTPGAGVQTDIETVAARGGETAIAVAALLTREAGVGAALDVPAAFLRAQLDHMLASGRVGAFKTGMLGGADRVAVVAEMFGRHAGMPYVLDPVMVAAGGHVALASDAVASLKRLLVPLATVITPDLAEAEALSGMTITTLADMRLVAEMLLTLGAPAILLRGRDIGDGTVTDILATDEGSELFTTEVAAVGPGERSCMLASALAAGLAQGLALRDAVIGARAYVHEAERKRAALVNQESFRP